MCTKNHVVVSTQQHPNLCVEALIYVAYSTNGTPSFLGGCNQLQDAGSCMTW